MNSEDMINILLVDDRPENLLALEAIIEKNDYNLIKASSGEEALKYLLKYDFAAILLDVHMPGMDGFGTAKIIKAREKTKNIPILFITANNMDSEHVFAGYSLGAIDYILKPFDPIILKSKVEGFVELYKMKQKLIYQANTLAERKTELEKAYFELSKITSELRISEALANVISETSIDSMLIIDKDGIILKINPAVKKMFQYTEDEILGKNISTFFSCEKSLSYINNVLEAINNLENIIGFENLKEATATKRDGTLFPVEIQIGKRFIQDKCIVACTIRDITKMKQSQEKIKHMAYHDGLTDLPNRRLFSEQFTFYLNKAKQSNTPLVILYLDMDRFKYINDSLGHVIGDKVLQETAKRLSSCLREGDFVARVGGDEFHILLPETNREKALELTQCLLDVLKTPFNIDNYQLYVSTCIGMSIFPFDGEDAQVLIKNADAALYRAKEQGKNKYKMYHSGMNIQSYRNFIMQNDLYKAIELDELLVFYQPRIDIKSGTISSAEALIRWNHSSWGNILPSEFIPLAEETGQIVKIGEWVLKSVCNQIKAWEKAGLPPIRVAVNFSAQQFLQKDLIQNIERIFNDTGVNPSLIEIEITEAFIMGNETIISQTLNQLKNMGIRISIDDFGTGFSSLNYLRRFPVNTLKIDKSFIQDITNVHSESTAIVSTIVTLAENLNMTVIAEGVEKEEQLNVLRNLNCQEFQGYLFSPPVLPKEFESFLLKNQENMSLNINTNHSSPENQQFISPDVLSNLNMEAGIDQNQDILNAALKHLKDLYTISTREMDVFKLIVNGLSNKEISEELFISEHTVKNHITRIFQKLTVNDRLQAMAKVYQTCIMEGKKNQT